MQKLKDILKMPREELASYKNPTDFEVDPLSMGKHERLSVYERPKAGHLYCAGADFAYGIQDRDFDACILLDKSYNPVRQVAELHGRWGHDQFDRLLFCLLRFYNNAFLVGERQVGLPVLRSLLTNFQYGYLYYERDDAAKSRPKSDRLGHAKVQGDPTITLLRRAIRDHELILRSEPTWTELKHYQFKPKGADKEKHPDMRDADLKMSAPTGMFDDLVNAGAYAWKGIREVHLFDDDRPKFREGTAGDVLGMADVLQRPKREIRGIGGVETVRKSARKPGGPFSGYGGR